MSDLKIVYISPGNVNSADPNVLKKNGAFGSWSTAFARHLLEISDKYQPEVWSMYARERFPDLNDQIVSSEKDGVCYKFFPASKFISRYVSKELLKELKVRHASGEKLLVHLQKLHSPMPNLIAWNCKKIPLVIQQRGPTCPPMWSFRFRKRPSYLAMALFDSLVMKNFDFAFACSIGETEFLRKKLGSDRVMHQKGGGFEFELYPLRSKEELRKELGLPLDAKIMIHVGRLNRLKGVDAIADVFKELREEFNLLTFFIGGNKEEELYQYIVDSGATVMGPTPRAEVLKYINASDVYLLPTFDKEWIPFGGIGTAGLEALALDVPLVSKMLINFMGSKEEQARLGLMPSTREELLEQTRYLLHNPQKFRNTRKIVEKYYTWEKVVGNNIKVYVRLFEKYYNVKQLD